ncbi:MAG: type II secretion system protein [Armatimonadota bacterium]
MRIFRPDSENGIQPSHTGADLGTFQRVAGAVWTRRWLSAAKFLVAPTIILIVAAILVPALIRARGPTYEARCMTKLRQVAAAIGMYCDDYDLNYPLAQNWHEALRSYIDNPADPRERVLPGSKADPLKCPSDGSEYPVSYLYLKRDLLAYSKANLSDSVTPLVVDEYFHLHTTLAYYDGHVEKMDRQLWVHQRNRQWEIRRDLDHPGSLAYEPVPGSVTGPTGPSPVVVPTERYIWPRF